ncbi:hypothetical protein WICPIJ_002516 [Wickerhamomyces pijperi]|uniref:Uncharacterized protein n=1 Tax=Wickerhamomyces pijperi TaxID=599730 RepID=A0A9P8QBP7_WICPI|nr:hypothetical protein WICPIJ_002516 [Wickerhamomyces pijperi]
MPFWSSSEPQNHHIERQSVPNTPGLASWAFQSLFSNRTPLSKYNDLNRSEQEQQEVPNDGHRYVNGNGNYTDVKERLNDTSSYRGGAYENVGSQRNDLKSSLEYDSHGRRLFGNEEDEYHSENESNIRTPAAGGRRFDETRFDYDVDTFQHRRGTGTDNILRGTTSENDELSGNDNGYRRGRRIPPLSQSRRSGTPAQTPNGSSTEPGVNRGILKNRDYNTVTPSTNRRFHEDHDLIYESGLRRSMNDENVSRDSTNGTLPGYFPGKFPSSYSEVSSGDHTTANDKKKNVFQATPSTVPLQQPLRSKSKPSNTVTDSDAQVLITTLENNNASLGHIQEDLSKLQQLPSKLKQTQSELQETKLKLSESETVITGLQTQLQATKDQLSQKKELLSKTMGHLESLGQKYYVVKKEYELTQGRLQDLSEKYQILEKTVSKTKEKADGSATKLEDKAKYEQIISQKDSEIHRMKLEESAKDHEIAQLRMDLDRMRLESEERERKEQQERDKAKENRILMEESPFLTKDSISRSNDSQSQLNKATASPLLRKTFKIHQPASVIPNSGRVYSTDKFKDDDIFDSGLQTDGDTAMLINIKPDTIMKPRNLPSSSNSSHSSDSDRYTFSSHDSIDPSMLKEETYDLLRGFKYK